MITQMPKRKKRFSFGKFILYLVLLLMIAALVRSYLKGDLNADTNTSETAASESRQSLSEYFHDKIYEKIYDSFADCRATVNIFIPSRINTIGDIYSEVISDHPEIFWEKGAEIRQLRFLFFTASYIKTDFLCSSTSLPAMIREMDSVIDGIVQEAMQYETDRERALFVHDRIVDSCTYDEALYHSGESASLSYTAYGCLVEHTAVCQGYAEAYKLILDRLGIPCGLITGTAENELGTGSHAWNYIILDGAYYMVDVTWDDPLNYYGPALHDYFCITSEQMGKDHFPENGWPPADWAA